MTFFEGIYQKFKEQKSQKGRTLILDTCALHSDEAMQRIEEASKVIILLGTIKELDKHKNDGGKFEDNIRQVCTESRKDEKSEKYVCVVGREKYENVDDNIIDYCRKHKKVTLLTSDNNLCNKAKAYQIPYLFVEREKVGRADIKGCTFETENLYISKEKNGRYHFVLREGKIIDFDMKLKLEKGDTVFQLVNKKDKVRIMQYEIVVIRPSNYAIASINVDIDAFEKKDLRKCLLPKEVKQQLLQMMKAIIQNEKVEVEVKTPETEVAKKEVVPKVKTQGIKDAEFKEGKLYLPKEKKRRYYFVFRNGEILDSDTKLEKGDIVF